MKTITKNFQNELVSDILSSSCFTELKSNVENVISKFRIHGLNDCQLAIFLNSVLEELKILNQGRLPYELHANIISAKNMLRKMQLDCGNSSDTI